MCRPRSIFGPCLPLRTGFKQRTHPHPSRVVYENRRFTGIEWLACRAAPWAVLLEGFDKNIGLLGRESSSKQAYRQADGGVQDLLWTENDLNPAVFLPAFRRVVRSNRVVLGHPHGQ